jgi:hypothetical protein
MVYNEEVVRKISEETKMTTCVPPSDCGNPSEPVNESNNTAVIGSCILCWGVAGLAIIAGLMGKLLDLF